MEPRDCSTKKRYVHLKESERFKIEVLLEDGKKAGEIAKILGRDRSTIYRELGRGTVMRERWDRRGEYAKYRAHVGQAEYERRGENKERSLKIGKDKKLEEYIRNKLVKEKFSPDAIIGQIKAEGLEFEGLMCTKTLYNYIEAGIFSGISNDNLWEKRKKKRRYRHVGRVSRTNRDCRSIEKRPKLAESRAEYGHWEGDTLKGPQGSTASLLTLTERKSREEIIIWLESATQEAIKGAIDGLEKRYGQGFKVKFKSITFDNGSEFLGWRMLEISELNGKRRTVTYFAHSYSSWERGTNEIHNRMIRRFIPKGTNMALYDQEEITRIQEWMNNYPRRILGYRTPNQVATESLKSSQFSI